MAIFRGYPIFRAHSEPSEAVGRAHQRLASSSGRCVDLWYTYGILISYNIYRDTDTPEHDLKYIHIHMYV